MISVSRDVFALAKTFTISRGSKTHAHVLTVRITRGGITGWGECVPYARYGETLDSVTAQIAGLPEGISRADLQSALPPVQPAMRWIARYGTGRQRRRASGFGNWLGCLSRGRKR